MDESLAGLMMHQPLLTSGIIEHAAQAFRDRGITSRMPDSIVRKSYAEIGRTARALAAGLVEMGVRPGDRVGIVAWSDHRHVELYYAISGIGAVFHSINPRYNDEQISYTINKAGERILFVDARLADVVARVLPSLTTVETIVMLGGEADAPLPRAQTSFEELAETSSDGFIWPEFDENNAAALGFTSATTGMPKGVLFSHRAIVLHALGNLASGAKPQSQLSVVLPMASMFHVQAWGQPFIAPICGSNLVLPGNALNIPALFELADREHVTLGQAVPTLWHGFLDHMRAFGRKPNGLVAASCGGSTASKELMRAYEQEFGIAFISGYGMTELTPTGSSGNVTAGEATLDEDAYWAKRRRHRPLYGIEMRIVDEAGTRVAEDGATIGELQCRGNWVAAGYHIDEARAGSPLTEDGWLRTGDLATVDSNGLVEIVDRVKDMIKSGGEWITPSIIEAAALSLPGVKDAAVVAVPHEKWVERPALVVVPVPGAQIDAAALATHLGATLKRWWVPDTFYQMEVLPTTSTGKLSKVALRRQLADGQLARLS